MGLQRMGLVDGGVLGAAVHLAGGGDDHPFNMRQTAGFEDIEGAHGVGGDEGGRRLVGVGDADVGGHVDDRIHSLHQALHLEGIGDITQDHFREGCLEDIAGGQDLGQVTPAAAAVVVHQGVDGMPGLQQLSAHLAGDKAPGAGKKNFQRRSPLGLVDCFFLFLFASDNELKID